MSKELSQLRKLTGYTVHNPDPIFNEPSRAELERAEIQAGLDPWPSYQQVQWDDATVFEKIQYGSKTQFEQAQRIRFINNKLLEKTMKLTDKEILVIKIKYSDVNDLDILIQDYHNYLEEEEELPPMTFDEWWEWTQEDNEFFASSEWQEEMRRLSEKD
jgi:hypothetical protein